MAHEKILVVDDEEAIREVISTLLDAQGFQCTTCANGKVGLEAFRKDSYRSGAERHRHAGNGRPEAAGASCEWPIRTFR